MTKATIAGLAAFINAQPATRTIDHSTWGECAVGDYVHESLGLPRYEGWSQVKVLYQEAGTNDLGMLFVARRVELNLSPSIMDELSHQRRVGRANYGQLRTALAEKFPELGFKQMAPFHIARLTGWVSGKLNSGLVFE